MQNCSSGESSSCSPWKKRFCIRCSTEAHQSADKGPDLNEVFAAQELDPFLEETRNRQCLHGRSRMPLGTKLESCLDWLQWMALADRIAWSECISTKILFFPPFFFGKAMLRRLMDPADGQIRRGDRDGYQHRFAVHVASFTRAFFLPFPKKTQVLEVHQVRTD